MAARLGDDFEQITGGEEAGAMTDADLGAVLVAGDVLTHARTLHVQRLRCITHGTYCVAKRPRPPEIQRRAGGVPRRA